MLTVWLITRSLASPERKKQLSAYAWCLSILLVAQILLGIEGWLSKYVAEIDPYTNSVIRVGWMGHEVASAIVRTAHVVIGTALLATSVVTTLRIWCVPLSEQDHGMRSSVYMDSGVRLGEPMTHS
jgi:heme A synthase